MNLIVNSHGVQRGRRPRAEGDRAARARRRPGLGARARPWAPGRCRRAPRRWSSTSPASTASATACIYFVDRYRDFSIYDVDFVFDAERRTASRRRSPACTTSAWCRAIYGDRTRDWVDFYRAPVRLLGAARGPVLRRAAQGHAAREPVPQVLPAADRAAAGRRGDPLGRGLVRIGLGAPDVPAATQGAARSAAWCSSTAARCSRARKARSRRSTSAA